MSYPENRGKYLFLVDIILGMIGILIFFSCELPPDPRDKINTKVSLLLEDSRGIRDDKFIEDSLGNKVKIGVAYYLPYYVDSVRVRIIGGDSLEFEGIWRSYSNRYRDTVWGEVLLMRGGAKRVILIPYSGVVSIGGDSGSILVHSRELPVNYKPEIEVIGRRGYYPGEICTLRIEVRDSNDSGISKLIVEGNPEGSRIVGDTFFVWEIGEGDSGEYEVRFIVEDMGIPVKRDTAEVRLRVSRNPSKPYLEVRGRRRYRSGEVCSLYVVGRDEDIGQEVGIEVISKPEGMERIGDSLLVWEIGLGYEGRVEVRIRIWDSGEPRREIEEGIIIEVARYPRWLTDSIWVSVRGGDRVLLDLRGYCEGCGERDSCYLIGGIGELEGWEYRYEGVREEVGRRGVGVCVKGYNGLIDTMDIILDVRDVYSPIIIRKVPMSERLTIGEDSISLYFEVKDESGIRFVKCYKGDIEVEFGERGDGVYSVNLRGLKRGENRIKIEAEDLAGNKDSLIYKIFFEPLFLDYTPPILKYISGPLSGGSVTEQEVYFVYKITDESGIADVGVKLNGEKLNNNIKISGDEYSFTVLLPHYGENKILLYAIDKSSNKNVDSVVILLHYREKQVCNEIELPPIDEIPENSKMPDPFKFFDGTPLTKKSQWDCRRKEIIKMAEKFVYGVLPPPPTKVSGNIYVDKLSIHCEEEGKSIDLLFDIYGYGDILNISFLGNEIPAPENSRTIVIDPSLLIEPLKYLFPELEIGSLITAVWILERIIDIVEQNSSSGISLSKIMVSGCGSGGKMALLAGAFCEKVTLTVVAEAGILGGSSFRMSEYFRHGGGAELYYNTIGTNELPQGIDNINKGEKGAPFLENTANEIISFPEKVKKLPFDQHLIMACIAPRNLIYLTNHQSIGLLGATCEALSAYCAKPVWDALGFSDNFLFAMSPTSYKSCMLPQFHLSLLSNFYKKVFKGENIKIDNLIINSGLPIEKEEWQERWIDWKMSVNLVD